MQASGHGGELRVGYQSAAQLGSWQVDIVQAIPAIRFSIAADILNGDAFWLTQTPIALDLRFGRFHWYWEAVTRAEITATRAELVVYGRPRITKDGEV